MRYAILSDIHANLQAWESVWEDIRTQGADCVISLGDLVGYGPDPAEVCARARQQVDIHLLGNHDAAVCDKIALSNWNPRAREMIAWTKKQLDSGTLAWLASRGHTLGNDFFRCTHSEFWRPADFYYIKKPRDALYSWRAVDEPLLFVGHTHRPALYVLGKSGIPRETEIQPFVIEPGKRYLANVGSVGFPRDTPGKGCYCLYEEKTGVVSWRRFSFDLATYRNSLARLGIDGAP